MGDGLGPKEEGDGGGLGPKEEVNGWEVVWVLNSKEMNERWSVS